MTMRCLPVTVGAHTVIIPMHWVMQVQQVGDEIHTPPTEDERTLPLLDMRAWFGTYSPNGKRFIIVIGSEEHAVCLLVDGVLPARTADAFTHIPALMEAFDSPFSAFWEPDKTSAPLPVLDVMKLLNETADRKATL